MSIYNNQRVKLFGYWFEIFLSNQKYLGFFYYLRKNSSILHNFDTFLAAFDEAFSQHENISFITKRFEVFVKNTFCIVN